MRSKVCIWWIILLITKFAKSKDLKVRKAPDIKMNQELTDAGKICQTKVENGPKDASPWLVAIYCFLNVSDKYSDVEFLGSGTIISKNYIVTSAYKTLNMKPNQLFVRLGDYNLMSPDDDLERGVINRLIDTVRIHDQFSTNEFEDDIALLKMNASIDFTKYIRPICVPGLNIPNREITRNDAVVTAGWRVDKVVRAYFKYAPSTVANLAECELALNNQGLKQHKFICTRRLANRTKGICYNDAGSPLMPFNNKTPEPILLGVAKFHIDSNCVSPHLFTKVFNYVKWIAENAK